MKQYRREAQVWVLGLCPLMLGLDMLAVGVALPGMALEFHAHIVQVQWLMTAFAIGYAGFMLALSRLGEVIGFRSVLLWGISLFIVSSGVIATSQQLWIAVLGRLFQGASGGALIVLALGFIASTFVDAERAKHLGTLNLFAGFGMGVGPIVGGFLCHYFGWRSIFLINIPIGLVAFVLVSKMIPISKTVARRVDVGGMISISIALSAFALAIAQSPLWGWLSPQVLGFHVIWMIAMVVFVLIERRHPDPILRRSFLTSRVFISLNVVGVVLYAVFMGWMVLVSLYLNHELGLGPLRIGLHLLPFGLMGGLAVLGMPFLLNRFSRRALIIAGMLLGACGLAVMSIASFRVTEWVVPGIALLGISVFVTNPICLAEGLIEMEPDDVASATGFSQMVRWMGTAIGMPLVTVFYATLRHFSSADTALHATMSVLALALVLCAVIAWLMPVQVSNSL